MQGKPAGYADVFDGQQQQLGTVAKAPLSALISRDPLYFPPELFGGKALRWFLKGDAHGFDCP